MQKEHLEAIRQLVGAIKREKAGKQPTRDQLRLLAALDGKSNNLPQFDSMAQCAAATGIPLAVLRAAKSNGVNGFAHSRVNLGEFLADFFSRDVPLDERRERARLLKAQADEQERENRNEDEEWLRKSEVEECIVEWLTQPLTSLFDSAPTTLDARCNPANPVMARKALEEWIEGTAKPLLRSKLPAKGKKE